MSRAQAHATDIAQEKHSWNKRFRKMEQTQSAKTKFVFLGSHGKKKKKDSERREAGGALTEVRMRLRLRCSVLLLAEIGGPLISNKASR